MEEVQKVVHGPTVESQKWSFLGHQNRHGAQHGFSCVCKSRFLNDWHNKWKHSVTISRFDHKKGHFLSSQIGDLQSDKKGTRNHQEYQVPDIWWGMQVKKGNGPFWTPQKEGQKGVKKGSQMGTPRSPNRSVQN